MPRWVDDTEDLDVITPDGTELVRVAKNGASKAVPISALADADLAAHVAASDPHAQYLKEATARDELGLDTNDDVTFKSVTVDDAAYDASTWNGSTAVPTRNAVRDKIASLAQADIAGLTTADSPQFAAVNLGHVSDTTLARTAAGRVAVEGVELARVVVPYGATTTINVPADYATIAAAWNAIKDWIITGTLIIQVADGTYTITSALTLEHPFGANIRLIGNTGTPTNCVIKVSTAINAIYVGDGCAVDLIDGFNILHDTPASRASTAGILADRGACVKCGTAVRVDGFYWGYFARRGGYIEAVSTQATNCGDAGYHALDDAMIDATSSTSTNNNASADSLGSGYVAEGAVIIANSATATGNWLHGFNAIQNGRIKCTNATGSTSTTGNGFNADTGGAIDANGANADGNGAYGWAIADDASIITGTITNTGTANTLGLSLGPYIIGQSAVAGTAPVRGTNITDSASVQVSRFSGDRATPAANDGVYSSWELSDSAGNQTEFARFSVFASSVTNGAETATALFSFIKAGSFTSGPRLDADNIRPASNDAQSLGTASVSWSDLFLASGGVINWNNGDVTVTHSSNLITGSGGGLAWSYDQAATPVLSLTNTADNANVELARLSGDRATAASSDQAYVSMYMSDTSGTQREAVRFTELVADGAGASWRTQLLISLATGGSLGSYYRFTTTALVPITNDTLALGSPSVGWADYYGAAGHRFYFNNSVFWTSGSGTPEGSVTAPVGAFYTRSDGGAGSTLYIKESGTGNTGWVAK